MFPIHAGWMFCLVTWLTLLPLWDPAPVVGREHLPGPILRQPSTVAAATYQLAQADERLLEEIQHGCFLYFWNEVGLPGELVKDRKKASVCSTAAVGFQLSSLPIGIERGWITREQGTHRAKQILETLLAGNNNRKYGVFLHFLNYDTGDYLPEWNPNPASTVDHALLMAGALPAAVYLGGEVAVLVDRLVGDTNWRAFDVSERGFVSFGWRPEDIHNMSGSGAMSQWDWHLASAEEQLVYFLAVGAPNPDFAVDPRDYYRLERTIQGHEAMPPYVVSWNGLLFTYFFSHCWIDYRGLGADDPSLLKIQAPRVDWFENSRRAVLTQRQRCLEMSSKYATLGPNRWGLSPCMGINEKGETTYLVQDIRPNLSNNDFWQEGTVAPYAAGSAIMFTPRESLAALREFRSLKDRDGKLLAWRDPDAGGYGLVDSFNLDQQHASDDTIGIDVGPMLLAIENVRSGLIWNLFMQHDVARRAMRRLRFRPIDADGGPPKSSESQSLNPSTKSQHDTPARNPGPRRPDHVPR